MDIRNFNEWKIIRIMEVTKISLQNLKIKLPEWIDQLGDKAVLAGGSIRDSLIGVKPSDYDIFVNDLLEIEELQKRLFPKHKCVHDSVSMKTLKLHDEKVQIIFKEQVKGSNNLSFDTINMFHFTMCQFSYNQSEKNILCGSESLVHLYEKKLVVHKLNNPNALDTFRSMQKYIKKGFTICNGGILEIVNSIRSISEEELTNQIEFYHDGSPRFVRFD
jgi:hypothetical protein